MNDRDGDDDGDRYGNGDGDGDGQGEGEADGGVAGRGSVLAPRYDHGRLIASDGFTPRPHITRARTTTNCVKNCAVSPPPFLLMQ